MNWRRSTWTGLAVLAMTAAVIGQGSPGFSPAAADELATPVGVSSRVYGQATPAAVQEPALALAKVTIAPGGSIPTHHHPGTQIGAIVAGELTYTVETGTVMLKAGDAAPDAPARPIPAGTTVTLHDGDTVIEQPDSLHHARNLGAVPVEIWLATLFPADAPRAIYEPAAVATPD